MATIKFKQRELLCKIVYYGPGLGGKTTNLQYIFKRVPEKYRGNLTSVDTKGDRTLFFDLLPLDYGKFRGFSVRLQLYTVPGQVIYNASRRIVLKGADGVVFVADSQVGRMDENIDSIKNLRDNLAEYGINWETIPTVLQHNKRDLSPICSIEELNQALNFRRLKWFEATAVDGMGVFPTLKGITAVVIENLKRDIPQAEPQKIVVKVQPSIERKAALRKVPETTTLKAQVTAPQPEIRKDSMPPEQIEKVIPKWSIRRFLSALIKRMRKQ